jgi:hypothetical protein
MKVTLRPSMIVALLLNTLCWALFLFRPTIPELVDWDADERKGYFDHIGTRPPMVIVASRSVTVRGHFGLGGGESLPVEAYLRASFPGLWAGGTANGLFWDLFMRDPQLKWLSQSNAGRSWLLAAWLFVGSSVWWVVVGWSVGSLWNRWHRDRAGPGNNEQPDNNGLELTRRGGAPASRAVVRVSPRSSSQCSTHIESRRSTDALGGGRP